MQIGGRVPPEHQGSQNSVGQWIYDKYVDSSSPRQINISGHVKAALDAAKNSNALTTESFLAAYITIMKTVNGRTGN